MRQHFLRAAAPNQLDQEPKDEHILDTTLILKGDGTNGQNNNTFVDSSASSHTVTRNGNTTQGSFSPFSPKGWSMYVDGTGTTQGIVGPTVSSILGTGTGDWTVEFWYRFEGVNTSGGTATWMPLINNIDWYNGAAGSFWLGVDSNQNVNASIQHSPGTFGTSAILTSTSTLYTGSWYHIAVVKQSNTGRLYINGTQEVTVSLSNLSSSGFHASSNTLTVGRHYNNQGSAPSTTTYGKGYFSNVRVTSSAVYPAGTTFIPSTEPLTAIADCKLLTLQDNRYIDNSSLNSTITAYDDAAIKPTSPFTGNREYPKASYFSGKFDGSNDYLEVNPGGFNKTNLGSSTATQGFVLGGQSSYVNNELRLCPNSVSSNGGMIKWQTPVKLNQDFSVFFKMNGSSPTSGTNYIAEGCSLNFSSSNASYTGSHTMLDSNRAYAVQCSAWTYDYIKIRDASATSLATSPSQGSGFLEGDWYFWVDYDYSTTTLSVYASSSSTKPSSPAVSYNQVTFTGADHYLAIGAGNGGSRGTWTLKEWSFSTNDFSPGTGDWTTEAWVYLTAYPNGKWGRLWWPSDDRDNIDIAGTDTSHGYNVGTVTLNRGGGLITSSDVLPLNEWVHVAVVRYNNTSAKIFFNGVEKASSTSFANPNSTSTRSVYIGFNGGTGSNVAIPGYISNVRYVREALYTTAFTPPTTPLTPIPNTKLLTLQDNYLVDHSSKGHSITNNGGVTLEPESPFDNSTYPLSGTFYSGYVDGNSDTFEITNSTDFNFGTGDFTIECWFNVSSFGSTQLLTLWDNYNGSQGPRFNFSVRTDKLALDTNAGMTKGTETVHGSCNIQTNEWHHAACVRDSTGIKLYLDGELKHSFATSSTEAYTPTNQNPRIGDYSDNYGTGAGYISNLRVVKGKAVYTSSFTVPTEPLTAIPGTVLLTLQNETVQDNSASSHSITTNGNATITEIAPFGTALIDRAGSMYFDGSGDYLTFGGTDFQFGTGDYTIEFWVYVNSVPSSVQFVYGGRHTSPYNYGAVDINFTASGTLQYAEFITASTSVNYVETNPINAQEWTHYALCRSAGTTRFYRNGVQLNSQSSTTDISSTHPTVKIGADYNFSRTFNGYLSDFRVIKGTGLYTSNFTPPTAPLQPITNTKLLLSGNNGGVEDSLGKLTCYTVGNMQVNTTDKKFGTGSISGTWSTGDYLKFEPDNNLWSLTGSYTIECWIRVQTLTSGFGIIGYGGTSNSYVLFPGWQYYLWVTQQGALSWNGYQSGTYGMYLNSANGVISTNTWYHIVVVKLSWYPGATSLYVNGTRVATTTSNFTTNPTASPLQFTVGGFGAHGGGQRAHGQIDDLRITKGVARYDPFQTICPVPTATLPTI